MNKGTVIRNFSRYAHLYDRYADIQRMAADRLIERLNGRRFEKILEIGCGTGNYTRLLRERFEQSDIKAVDISPAMIRIARQKLPYGNIEFIICDAECVELNESLDLITANSSFQWIERIDDVIVKYKKALADNGIIAFSYFGPLTFRELNLSLGKASGKRSPVSSKNFLEKGALELILKKHLKEVAITEIIIKKKYLSLAELLDRIRYTGVRGGGLNGKFTWNRGLLRRTEEIYMGEFGQIEASYQIFFCKAMK